MAQRNMRLRLGWCLLGLMVALPSLALDYSPALDNSEWAVQGSVFECQLTQPIPDFGTAIFEHQAGEPLSFQLRADVPRMKAGRALLSLAAPPWKPDDASETVGYIDVEQDRQAINLDESQAQRVLQALYLGQQIEISRRAWYNADETVRVALSNINFRGAYDAYVGCQSQLLPVNYGQIERTSLLFLPGQETLTSKEKQVLDDILAYSKADPDVRAFYVDGHSDSQGTRAENLEISKRRAEMVMRYLLAGGLAPEMIMLRWHGERYPVASNRTASGRAENRRVTLRLSKEPLPSLPEIETPKQEETAATTGSAVDAVAAKLGIPMESPKMMNASSQPSSMQATTADDEGEPEPSNSADSGS